MEAIPTIIAGIAIVVSVSTFALTYRASRQAERRERMPVLVVFPAPGGAGWCLENIGSGAALNIVIAQGHGSQANGGLIELPGETAGAARFKTDAQFARVAGVAPIEASSGKQQRHRLNRHGNRQLNSALHKIAIV